MRIRNHWWITALTIGALVSADACVLRRGTVAPEAKLILEVQNHSDFEVTIHALPSTGSFRVRIGSVTPFSYRTFALPRDARRSGGSLLLQLHAIGAAGSWVTPEVQLFEGAVACLDIVSDRSGDLSRSVLYSALAADSVTGSSCGLSTERSQRLSTQAGRLVASRTIHSSVHPRSRRASP